MAFNYDVKEEQVKSDFDEVFYSGPKKNTKRLNEQEVAKWQN